MKRMLVNATQQEELRVAMVDGQQLYDLDIEVPSREQRKANIYKGRITRLEPSLEAAFVDYGAERHGFLPLKEISSEYFLKQPEPDSRINIKDVLKEGQEIVVQVEKEERGTKGAALTTFVSLAGRFIVLMPNNPRAGGVSRRITGEDRDVVRESLDELSPPDNMGCIVRTAGVGREIEELRWDLDYLLKVWDAIKGVVVSRPAPFLIYQEGNSIVRALRDYFSDEIGEILIDDPDVYRDAEEFMSRVLPQSLRKLKLYEDTTVPLFTRFQIESQIESAYAHTVSLPSGGSIVIDHTEALTAIDINSARSTKGEDIEQTAFTTNLEAADEIGRQLRIRDLGGLVVVDFIDMGPQRNQREVENRLRDAVRTDRARIQIGKISRFGLLEMSRQRLRPSLEESTQLTCPRCGGNGVVRGVESLALAVLRLVGEEARKDRTAKVISLVPLEVGNYILNEKREWVQSIQQSNDVEVIVVSDPELETPNYTIRRVRDDETGNIENVGTSYRLVQAKEDLGTKYEDSKQAPKAEAPAVGEVLPETPAPTVEPKKSAPQPDKPSLWARIRAWFSSESSEEPKRRSSRGQRSSSPRGRKPARKQSQGERRSSGSGRKSRSRSDSSRGGQSARSGGQAAPAKGGGESASGGGGGGSAAGGGGSGGGGTRKRRSRGRRGRGSGGQGQRNRPDRQETESTGESSPAKTNGSKDPAKSQQDDVNRTDSKPEAAAPRETAAQAPAANTSQNTAPAPVSEAKPAPQQPTPEASAPKAAPQQPQPEASAPKAAPQQPQPEASAPKPAPQQPQPEASAPKPAPQQPQPEASAPKPAPQQPQPEASAPKAAPQEPKPSGDGGGSASAD